MKTWKACPQYNGNECSIFTEVEFNISDELYSKIQDAISRNIPLRDCDFYEELELNANSAVDFEELTSSETSDEEDCEDPLDDWCFVGTNIYDPGDYVRFKDAIIGRTINEDYIEGSSETEIELCREDEVPATYTMVFHHDEDGRITDVDEAYASGLQSEGLRYSDIVECYPDYLYIFDALIEEGYIQ